MTSTNGLNPDAIKAIKDVVSRVEALESEKAGLMADIKEVYEYGKDKGLNVKTLKALIKKRKRSSQDIQIENDAIELYEAVFDGDDL